jgi:hypothetical protein
MYSLRKHFIVLFALEERGPSKSVVCLLAISRVLKHNEGTKYLRIMSLFEKKKVNRSSRIDF